MGLSYKEMKSPVGRLRLVANDRALVAVLWETEREGRVRLEEMTKVKEHKVLDRAEAQLREYFAGRRTAFDLPLEPKGTDFQKRVWTALEQIPFGETRSYKELAESIGLPKASRAVGAANGRNPLSIVVPCHRVIGASGRLTGFAGGLSAKETLLALEGGDRMRERSLAFRISRAGQERKMKYTAPTRQQPAQR